MFDSTKEDLKDILRKADDGKLQLPDFQRDYVWGDDDVRSLIASIAKGFPVGALLSMSVAVCVGGGGCASTPAMRGARTITGASMSIPAGVYRFASTFFPTRTQEHIRCPPPAPATGPGAPGGPAVSSDLRTTPACRRHSPCAAIA
jgi:hypothetical protein